MSQWQGESATLVISLGESADRAAYNPYDSKTHKKLEYKITLTSAIETLNFYVSGGSSFEAHVATGDWNVWIVSYLDGDVYAAGSKDVNLKLGVNNEAIDMYEAHLVKFDSNGGSAVPEQVVFHDSKLIPLKNDPSYPNDDSQKQISFKGWHTDSSLEEPFYFEDKISKSITLYAKWGGFNIDLPQTSSHTLLDNLKWLEDHAVNGGDYIIEVFDDDPSIDYYKGFEPYTLSFNGKKVSITLISDDNEHTGERNICLPFSLKQGSLFTVGAGVTLKLDNNIILNGCCDNNFSVVVVERGGTLVMREESSIYGGSDGTQRGVYVADGGIFTMYGGKIYKNSATNGGGVYVDNGTFTMNGGVIEGNNATNGGGGVYVDAGGTFTMNSGEISGNSEVSQGGGVYVADKGTFTMYGGKISDNSAENGAGVYIAEKGSFIMEDGEISNNECESGEANGGGVYVAGTFTMYGGKISNSNRAAKGGGVYVVGTFIMKKGEIFDNAVYSGSRIGAGVFLDNTGIFNMEGGNIYRNYAETKGGGVFIYSGGIFNKTNGTITGIGHENANFVFGGYSPSFDPVANETGGNAVYVGDLENALFRREKTAGQNDPLSYNGTTGATTGIWNK